MNKSDLLNAVASETNVSKKDVTQVIDAVVSVIEKRVAAGEEVVIPGFAKFQVAHRAARVGRNPQTGAEIKIAAAVIPSIKPLKGFKDAVAAAHAAPKGKAAAKKNPAGK